MLIRFGLGNFRSFSDYKEINFTVTSLKGGKVDFLEAAAKKELFILPVTGIYGPNNSGKSNLLLGLERLRSLVLRSHVVSDKEEKLPYEPFKLNPQFLNSPTVLDVDFLVDGVRYHYGIRYTQDEIVEEWLYSFPKAYRQVWFHRATSEGKQGDVGKDFYFGPSLKGQNTKISELTKKNSLFISTAAAFGHEQLDKIFQFFKQKITYVGEQSFFELEEQLHSLIDREDCDKQAWITTQLTKLGTGISEIVFHEERMPERLFKILSALGTALKEAGSEEKIEPPSKSVQRTWASHVGTDGDVEISLVYESRGTRSLVAILSFIYDATQLNPDTTLIVDELDTSLHTMVCDELLRYFTDKGTNPSRGQFLFTTHDTNLLLSENLRRDSIWFTEMPSGKGTQLYSLSEIRTKITDNFELGYLRGRYGGIPIMDSLFAAAVARGD